MSADCWVGNKIALRRSGAKCRYVTVRVFKSRNSKPRNVRLSERGAKMLKTHGPEDRPGIHSSEWDELTAFEVDQ